MPRLTDAERAVLDNLAAPIDGARRPEFRASVERAIEAADPATVGEGSLHRTAREILLRGFWDPPPDLRAGRLGPRGPRG
jgi:hypothetical protein